MQNVNEIGLGICSEAHYGSILYFKAPKNRTCGNFPESRAQTAGYTNNNDIKPNKYRSVSPKTLSYNDMKSLILFKYFKNFNGQRKMSLYLHMVVSDDIENSRYRRRAKRLQPADAWPWWSSRIVYRHLFGWLGGSTGTASASRSNGFCDPRFEPRQEHNKNGESCSESKNVVLTRCRCAQLPVCIWHA